jgi:endonuclease YncB( thermonuclease family)
MLDASEVTERATTGRIARAGPPGSVAVVLDDAGVVEQAQVRPARSRALWVVEQAIDGDTLTVRSGSRRLQVRLLGIDAPELNFRGQRQSPWAEAALRQLRSLAPRGAQVELMTDQQAVDQYGRLLAYVVRGRRNLNLELLHSGWAVAYLIYPNLRLLPHMQAATAAAAARGRGIFDLRTPLPLLPYELRQRVENRPPSKFCGDTRTRRYYSPDEYQRVPVAWRVFFFTEAHARAFGYSPAVPFGASMDGLGGERFEGAPVQGAPARAASAPAPPSVW